MILIYLALTISSISSRSDFSNALPPQTIQSYAAEDLVFKSMGIQGTFMYEPTGSLKNKIEIAQSNQVIWNTLDLIIISQKMLKEKEAEVLKNFSEDPNCYAETVLQYAKYSNCPVPQKLDILNRIIALEDSEELFFIRGKAAFELLKHSDNLNDKRKKELLLVLRSSWERYEQREIAIASLWKFMAEVHEELQGNQKLYNLIQSDFPTILLKKIKDSSRKSESLDNFYGVMLTPRETFYTVPERVVDYWNNINRKSETK